jgi:hypothetical protein
MSEIRNSSLLRKITIFFVICCLVMGSLCLNTAAALDGSGTEQDPWLIQSLDDFNDFTADANYWNCWTRLETDVHLAGLTYTTAVIAPDTNNSNLDFEGTAFTGVFDGNDHKIINLNIDDGGAGNSYLGLFGQTYDGKVKNLSLEGGSVSGDSRVGCLVGFNCHGSLSNCYSTGSVSGGFGYGSVGGLVGWNNGGSISDCYSTGSVSGVISGGCGGLVGWNNGGSISDCYSTGDVIGPGDVGGLVGINGGSILNCYSTGDVSGNTYVGGLVGFNVSTIRYCYSTGSVSGEYYVGGLVGFNLGGSISNGFWDIDTQTHGVTESIGYNDGGTITNVHGLPTSQLHQQSSFADWDFINVWNIGENQTYPYLRTYLAGDINKDGIVNFLDLSITSNQWMEGIEE